MYVLDSEGKHFTDTKSCVDHKENSLHRLLIGTLPEGRDLLGCEDALLFLFKFWHLHEFSIVLDNDVILHCKLAEHDSHSLDDLSRALRCR